MSNILVISPTPTHPANAGNRVRIYHMLKALQERGHRITFLYIVLEQEHDPSAMQQQWNTYHEFQHKTGNKRPSLRQRVLSRVYRFLGRQYYIPNRIDDWYPGRLHHLVLDILSTEKIDCVITEYVFLSKIFNYLPEQVCKVLDTHDIFTDRHKVYLRNGLKPSWFFTTKREEARALNRADSVLAIQEEDKRFFESITKTPVVVVGDLRPEQPLPVPVNKAVELLYVGSKNKLNVHSMEIFLEKIYPGLLEMIPSIRLSVAGTVCEKIKLPAGLEDHSVQLLGRVADLEDIYQRHDIVINPMLLGTGLKIKCIEAIAYGKPLITSRIGAAGLEQGIGTALFVAESTREYAAHIEFIMQAGNRAAIQKSCVKFIHQYNQQNMTALESCLQ
jgi:glycosyltransferase involved in cell wall biosynthesis